MALDPTLLQHLREALAATPSTVVQRGRRPWWAGAATPEDWQVFADALDDEGDPRADQVRRERAWAATRDARHIAGDEFESPTSGLRRDMVVQHLHGFATEVRIASVARLEQVLAELSTTHGTLIWRAMVIDKEIPDIVREIAKRPVCGQLLGLHALEVDAVVLRQLLDAEHLRGVRALDLTLDREGLTHLLTSRWRPRRLRITNRDEDLGQAFAEAPALAEVEVLEIQGPPQDMALTGFLRGRVPASLRQLTLRLQSDEAVGALAELEHPHLAHLHVRGVQASLGRLAELIASPGLPALRSLYLADAHPRAETAATVPLPDHVEPLYLTVSGRGLTDDLWRALAATGVLARVGSLSLWTTTEHGIVDLLTTADLSRLRQLVTGGQSVGPAFIEALARRPADELPLEALHLATGPVGDAGVKTLLGSSLAPRLRELSLGNLDARPETVFASLRDADLTNLEVLNLRMSQLDQSVAWLAESRTLRPRDLHVPRGGPTLTKAIVALAGSPVLERIQRLTLPSAHLVFPATVEALLASPYLGQLEILELEGPASARGVLRDLPERGFKAWPMLKDIVGLPLSVFPRR